MAQTAVASRQLIPYIVSTKTANYSPAATFGTEVILVDATSGNITITLPSAVSNKCMYIIQKTDSSVNTVTDGTNTILFQYTSYTLISNNASWIRIQ